MPIGKIVFHEEQIKNAISSLSFRLNQDYEKALIIGVLDGCLPFFDCLLPRLNFPFTVRFVKFTRYKDAKPSPYSVMKAIMNLEAIQGQDVLVVDDIIDEGVTYANIEANLKHNQPSSINGCFLVQRGEHKEFYTGLTLPPDCGFVVGFGMDFNNQHRNLTYIAEWE
jgi:hypoxanthine phosphoribosyltransferase